MELFEELVEDTCRLQT